jgi:hypothetical protein
MVNTDITWVRIRGFISSATMYSSLTLAYVQATLCMLWLKSLPKVKLCRPAGEATFSTL